MQSKQNHSSEEHSAAASVIESGAPAATPATPAASRPLIKRGCTRVLSVTLAAALACMTPAAAFASDEDVAAAWVEAAAAQLTDDPENSPSLSSSQSGASASLAAELPSAYSQLDPNSDGDQSDSIVTPVKYQQPWGACWAFSAISASETSILSKLGKSYAETGLDLSERQLVNSIYRKGGAPESAVGAAQAGEGFIGDLRDPDNPNRGYDISGLPLFGFTAFASGYGLVDEVEAPWGNDDGIYVCDVTLQGSTTAQSMNLTDEQIASFEKAGATVVKKWYTGNYRTDLGTVYTNWSTDDSLWGQAKYTLGNGNILPDTRVLDAKEQYDHTDMDAVAAIKNELYEGHGVTAAFHSEADSPTADNPITIYMNGEVWAHYTWGTMPSTHAITIVGWDDDFSSSNFKNTEGKYPEGNGAWLVKNSWGASTADFPNHNDWGIEDEDGNNTGYFWISYYDQSIRKFLSFDFDVSAYSADDDYYISQYDYLPEYETIAKSYDEPTSSASIFTAEGDMTLSALSCSTFASNTTVTYQVYLLDDEATTPTDSAHSKLAGTFNETYQYAGYHRSTLPAADGIAMRSGQRFAVVTTQKCNDDGKYYQGVIANRPFLFESRVNEGESFSGTTKGTDAAASGETAWTDWTVVAKAITEEQGYNVDNVPVKAFSDASSFASVEELDSLAQALAKARGVLDAAAVSDDGSDVYTCDTWMTQAEHDSAAAAVSAAEGLLDAAGDYKTSLANTTPSSDEVAAAVAALAFEARAGAKAAPAFPDVDYSEGCWYAGGVTWCAARGMFSGYPDGTFGVGVAMDRAELATALWRHYEPGEAAAYDQASAKASGAVDGVEDAAFYTGAANWAVASGVIQGYEREGSARRDFAPWGRLTFEQLVCVVARASGADYGSSDLAALDRFSDKGSVSGWAAHAMAWAVEEGLVTGWDNAAEGRSSLAPGDDVARERAAVVLERAFKAGVLR